jgi:hypothetical protein
MLLTIPWVLATISGRVDMPVPNDTEDKAGIGGYRKGTKKASSERLSDKNKYSLKNSGTIPFVAIKQGA